MIVPAQADKDKIVRNVGRIWKMLECVYIIEYGLNDENSEGRMAK